MAFRTVQSYKDYANFAIQYGDWEEAASSGFMRLRTAPFDITPTQEKARPDNEIVGNRDINSQVSVPGRRSAAFTLPTTLRIDTFTALAKCLLGRDTVSAAGVGRYKHLVQPTDDEDLSFFTLDAYQGAYRAGDKALYRFVGALANTLGLTFDASQRTGLVTADWGCMARYHEEILEPDLPYTNPSPTAYKQFASWTPIVTVNLPGTTTNNERQRIVISGVPTGGTYTLRFDYGAGVQTTSALAYNAAPSAVQAALEALTNIGAGNVTVTGIATNYVVEFVGSLAGIDVPELVPNWSNLTGGAPLMTSTTIVDGFSDPAQDHYFQTMTLNIDNGGEEILGTAGVEDVQGINPGGRAATMTCRRILKRGDTETFADLSGTADTFDLKFDIQGFSTAGDGLDRLVVHAPKAEITAFPPRVMNGGHKVEDLTIVCNRDDTILGPIEFECYSDRAQAF